MAEQEVTELVDVSEVPQDFAEEPKKEEEVIVDPSIASLRERFTAFFIDSAFFFYCYFLIGIVARRAFYGTWDGPIPTYGWQGLTFHGVFLFFCFMYYFIMESVFYCTIGKFSCWMYVRRKDGSFASMSSIFFRNVLRFLDYLVPLIPIFCMELTKRTQRLGDLLSGTIVIKKNKSETHQYSVSMANIASASGRFLSSLLDIVIVFGLTAGFILFLSPDYPFLSKWLLLLSPIPFILYFVTAEVLTHASPGKWVFGYVISQEDGRPLSFSSSFIRTIIRPFDLNPVGLLAMWLSPRKQRFGDLAADTIVTRQKRRLHGGVSLAVWVFISGIVLWLGMQNENNIIRAGFKTSMLPTMEFMGRLAEESTYKELTLTHIRFAAGSVNTIRTPPVFNAGETVYLISDVYGYEKSGRMVWIQEDLDVKYPDMSIGLHQENIVDYHQVVPTRGPVELTNSIKLPETAQPGTYAVTITVRDLFGHEHAVSKQTFEVKPSVQALPAPSP